MSAEITPESVLDACRAAGLKLATAESCTGGMVSARLIDVAGSSDVVLGGIVAYSNAAKRDVLGVDTNTLKAYGAVSEETAVEMAEGARRALRAGVAVGITGIAGPGGAGDKPEGRVCFAVAREGMETRSETQDFGALGRDRVRAVSRDRAMELLKEAAEFRP
ncbi:damage-inducible protein CinA [Oceanicola sp. 22II-s10i]|uniref:CinA family protein n=1 Tax=Oceanicola sp. 22II-s10i TaxID=1317116 RepID=UPI000B5261A4|nr:CinA family protein [Oceanicola sp. 22II-s10i]OWU84874.1 damage-inducible protein CinA [Oceanicola sp. 22II-s10i]